MRAAVCREFGQPLTIEEVSLAPPDNGQVEVKIEACAICHSDIHFMKGAWGGPTPAIFGHEAVGRIVRMGQDVAGWSKGDRVLVTLLKSCGSCLNCSHGHPAQCENGREESPSPFSLSETLPVSQGLWTGAFAERTVVDQSQIAHVPDSISNEAACLLSCGVITGVGAVVNTARVYPGSAVAVVGAGGVGLNAIQGARISGASVIAAVDISARKLEDAREFGATHGILADSEKPHRQIRQVANGRGVDFALVTVGSVTALEMATRFLCHGGKLIIVGMPSADEILRLNPMGMAYLSQSVIGSYMGDAVLRRDIPWLLSLYDQGRLKLDPLVTGRYKLDEINEAVQNTIEGKARRNVIVF